MIRRLRTLTLWTGALLSVLIAATFVVSGWWGIVFQVPKPSGPGVAVNSGVIVVAIAHMWSPGFAVERIPLSPAYDPRWPHWRSWNSWAVSLPIIIFPIYALFLAVAIPTLLVCRFWSKPVKSGCCRCGYDLTGNTSGVCPECGVEVQA